MGASLIVYWSEWPTVLYLAIAIYIGLVVYLVFYFERKSKKMELMSIFETKHIKSGLWVPIYIIVLTIESYIGESGLGGANYVPYPWDMIMVIIVAIIFYYWAEHSGVRTEEVQEIIDLDSQYLTSEDEPFSTKGGE